MCFDHSPRAAGFALQLLGGFIGIVILVVFVFRFFPTWICPQNNIQDVVTNLPIVGLHPHPCPYSRCWSSVAGPQPPRHRQHGRLQTRGLGEEKGRYDCSPGPKSAAREEPCDRRQRERQGLLRGLRYPKRCGESPVSGRTTCRVATLPFTPPLVFSRHQ